MLKRLFKLLAAIYLLLMPVSSIAETQVLTYFKNTDYELNVYKIHGHLPGKTLMIIGGIQGDEAGGYLTADMYADISLQKGNLIVVPRANLLSILQKKRAVYSDMNRRFLTKKDRVTYEDEVVDILETLIKESDYLLNLHEGSGFYSDQWEGPSINPDKFGQSIIADSEEFTTSDGRTIRLGELARRVAKRANEKIENIRHHFRFNNHRTFDSDTRHPEQRKSATYFALSSYNIPSFGIETSKDIKDLRTKVRYESLVINEFMNEVEILPENPKIVLDPPRFRYMIVSVNGVDRVVKESGKIEVNKGDIVKITHLEANYRRGLTVDLLTAGTENDLNVPFKINAPVSAVVRKDGALCGSVQFVIAGGSKGARDTKTVSETVRQNEPVEFRYLIVENNGVSHVLKGGEHFRAVKGDTFRIIDVVAAGIAPDDIKVNLVGFIGNKRVNDGEDRGYSINTASELIGKYSVDKAGGSYEIKVTMAGHDGASLYLDITKPELAYIVVRQNDAKQWLSDGDVLSVYGVDALELIDVKTNITDNAGVALYLNDTLISTRLNTTKWQSPIRLPISPNAKASEYKLVLSRLGIPIGKATIRINKQMAEN